MLNFVDDMRCIYIIITVVATVYSVSSTQTKEVNASCRGLCCSGYNGNNGNDNNTRLETTRNLTEVSNCIEKCRTHDSGTRNTSNTVQSLCDDHIETEIHFERNKTKNNCKALLKPERATNNFVSVAKVTSATFHKEGNRITTNNYYINITWQPVNITDLSKTWSHYIVMWFTGILPLNCQLVAKNQTFFVINSTQYKYPGAIEFNVFTYPLKKDLAYNLGNTARPRRPLKMVRATLPTSPVVTPSLMAAIIVGSCVGVAFFVAVAVAWKLNLRVHSIQDIRLYWEETIGSGRKETLRTTTSEQTIVEEQNQVYLSYFQEDVNFWSIVECLFQTLTYEGFNVKIYKMCTTEMIEEGPERWAQKHIATSAKVVVLCSPSYINICQRGKEAVINGHPSEESRVWFEVQIISHIYSKYKSASKIVCIWCNKGVPDGLPPWMSTTYTWPQEKDKILKRLLTKSHKRSSTRESRTSTAESKRRSSLSTICDDDVFSL